MKLGNKIFFLSIILLLKSQALISQDDITTSPLINLNELKPSFEEEEILSDEKIDNSIILNKKENHNKESSSNGDCSKAGVKLDLEEVPNDIGGFDWDPA